MSYTVLDLYRDLQPLLALAGLYAELATLTVELWLLLASKALQQPYAVIEVFSALCGLSGSLLLALKGKHAGWGWVLFAFSNVGWISFGHGHKHWFFVAQMVGFSVTSAIGIWQYLLAPAIDKVFDDLDIFKE